MPGVEAMDTQSTQEDAEEQRDEPILLGSHDAGGRYAANLDVDLLVGHLLGLSIRRYLAVGLLLAIGDLLLILAIGRLLAIDRLTGSGLTKGGLLWPITAFWPCLWRVLAIRLFLAGWIVLT